MTKSVDVEYNPEEVLMFRIAVLVSVISINLHAEAYLYENSFVTGTPAHCGGVNWCSTAAETALRAVRFSGKPNNEGSHRVWASNDGTHVEIVCAIGSDSQMHANLKVTSENMESVNTWGAKIFKMIQGIRCL